MELDKIYKPHIGCLLISEPFSDDDFFCNSVVLLTDFSEEKGAVGFVLNKKTIHIISDLVESINISFSVYQGGPVQSNFLSYIHPFEDIYGALKIHDTLYWGGDFEQFQYKIQSKDINKDNVRWFLGYSGWSKGQLEDEIKQGFWAVCPAIQALRILEQNEISWQKVVWEMGTSLKSWQNKLDRSNLNQS